MASGAGSTDRGGRTDTRQRRNFQKLGIDPFSVLGIEAGDGVVLDSALGTISIDLATNPGLAFSSGDLIVIVGNGLELTATGIEVDLATNPGLAFSSGDLIVTVGNGLELTVTGIEIDLLASGGLAFSTGDLTVDLRDTTPALELTANGIGVLVGAGLELTATGVEIDLLASGGLAFSTGDLTIDLRDTNPALELTVNGIGVLVSDGLELTASGVAIDLAANPGLAFSTGDLTVTVGAGIELTATGIEVDLATDPGLEFNSGDIRVKVKTAGGITRDSDGLSTTEVLDSGFFTPTLTNSTNVASSAAYEGVYHRVGDVVSVYLRVDVTPTSTSTNTDLLISLPVALNNNFPGFLQAFGAAATHNNPDDGMVGVIFSNSGAQNVILRCVPTTTSLKGFHLSFSYSIDQPA